MSRYHVEKEVYHVDSNGIEHTLESFYRSDHSEASQRKKWVKTLIMAYFFNREPESIQKYFSRPRAEERMLQDAANLRLAVAIESSWHTPEGGHGYFNSGDILPEDLKSFSVEYPSLSLPTELDLALFLRECFKESEDNRDSNDVQS